MLGQGYQLQVFRQANFHCQQEKCLIETLDGMQTLLVLAYKVGLNDRCEGVRGAFGELSTNGMTKVDGECCRDFLQMKIEILAALNDRDLAVLLHGEAPS